MNTANVQNLDDLLAAILDGRIELNPDLPVFGGEEPRDTHGIWSWDEERLLVSDPVRIIPRPVRCACGEITGEACGWEGHGDLLVEVAFIRPDRIGLALAANDADPQVSTYADRARVHPLCADLLADEPNVARAL